MHGFFIVVCFRKLFPEPVDVMDTVVYGYPNGYCGNRNSHHIQRYLQETHYSQDDGYEATEAIPGEVEGVNTCQSVVKLSEKHEVEMPITEAVYNILFEGKSVAQAIGELMTRRLKAER